MTDTLEQLAPEQILITKNKSAVNKLHRGKISRFDWTDLFFRDERLIFPRSKFVQEQVVRAYRSLSLQPFFTMGVLVRVMVEFGNHRKSRVGGRFRPCSKILSCIVPPRCRPGPEKIFCSSLKNCQNVVKVTANVHGGQGESFQVKTQKIFSTSHDPIGPPRCMVKFLNMVGNDLLPTTSDGSQIPP